MRYVALARTSTQKQQDNLSVDVQLQSIHQYASDSGWLEASSFTDNASRTSFEDREGLQKALELIRNKEAEVVVYYDVSRIGVDDSINRFINTLYGIGGKLAVATERRIFPTKGEALEQTFWTKAVSTYEYLQIQKRTRNGKRRAMELGGYIHRQPFGYRLVTEKRGNTKIKVLEIDPIEAKYVRRIIDGLIEGRGKYELASELNKDNYRKFNYNFMDRIVKHAEKYVGGTEYRTMDFDGETVGVEYSYPQIISEDTYKRLQTALRVKPKKHTDNKPTPFKGVTYCTCGEEIQNNGVRYGTVSLSCNSYKKRAYAKAQNLPLPENYCPHMISHKKVATAVEERLLAYPEIPEAFVLEFDNLTPVFESQLKDVELEVGVLTAEIEGLTEKLLTAENLVNVAEVFETKISAVKNRKEKLLIQKVQLEERIQLQKEIAGLLRKGEYERMRHDFRKAIQLMKKGDWYEVNRLLFELDVRITLGLSDSPVSIEVGFDDIKDSHSLWDTVNLPVALKRRLQRLS